MPSTRDRALGAAIELLGTRGLKALSHGRVDERADLPKGSTSNHFRTRAALLEGVVDEIVRLELESMGEPTVPQTPEDLVELLAGWLEYATGPRRVLTTARLVLFVEASHDQRLRESLARGRAAMEAWSAPLMARLGARDDQQALLAISACVEGLLLHRIARHDTTDPRPAFELVVHAALA